MIDTLSKNTCKKNTHIYEEIEIDTKTIKISKNNAINNMKILFIILPFPHGAHLSYKDCTVV